MANSTQTPTNLGTLGKPFAPCPTIRVFADLSTVKNNLKNSSFADIADDLAGDMSTAWERSVFDALTTLSSLRCYAARCVLKEIDWYGKRGNFFVFIVPRDMVGDLKMWMERTDIVLSPQERVIKASLNASSAGRQGNTGPGSMADASKNQRGAGDTAVVRFDPLEWDPQNQFRNVANQIFPGKYGPYGTSPSEALLHELVHAMHTIKGMTDGTLTGPPFNDSFEEFSAVLVTNIHTAELAPGGLRSGHNGFAAMPPSWSTSQGFLADRNNRENVKYLIRQDPSFYNNLAQTVYVDSFNPVRLLLRPFGSVAN